MGAELKTRDVCWASGPAVKLHELVAVMRERERRGEVVIMGPVRAQGRAGVAMPYVLKARQGWARRRRTGLLVASAVSVYGLTALALLWEARFIVMIAAGVLLAAAGVYYVLAHSGTCPGLHCPCCKG